MTFLINYLFGLLNDEMAKIGSLTFFVLTTMKFSFLKETANHIYETEIRELNSFKGPLHHNSISKHYT